MIFPIGDQNEPGGRRAPVTLLIILANFAVFLLLQLPESGKERQPITYGYSTIPYEITHNVDLVGPKEITVGGERGLIDEEPGPRPIWLTIFTSMFLHGGWLHILGNMLFLFIFGNNVEDRFGRLKFLLFYVFCGYVAAYGFAYGNPDSTTTLVGASGAIAGVLGAYLVMFPRARVMSIVPIAILWIPIRLPAWLVLGGWFLLQWLYSSGSGVASGAGVAYLAHVYGFVAGVLVALLLRPMLRDPGPVPVRGY